MKTRLKKGHKVPSPYTDKKVVVIQAVTEHGVAFKHPSKGVCGMRWDSMTDRQRSIFTTS